MRPETLALRCCLAKPLASTHLLFRAAYKGPLLGKAIQEDSKDSVGVPEVLLKDNFPIRDVAALVVPMYKQFLKSCWCKIAGV